jgi:hypothetical protein
MTVAPPRVRTLGLSWPLLVAVLGFAGPLAFMARDATLADPDAYWHVATGRWMIEHGALPAGDPFSHTMPGAPWMLQSWLSEWIMAMVHGAWGWAGLVVLAAGCFALTLALVTRFLLARMQPVHALLFVGLAASALMSHLVVRPHVLTWPLIVAWVAAQVDASEARRGPPWRALPVMWLWANLHGGFTLGLALAALLALDAVMARDPAERRGAALRWGSFVAAAAIVSMLTPNGWPGLWYTVQVMQQGFAQAVIGEWQSPNFHRPQPVELWIVLMLVLGWTGRMQLPAGRILVLLLLLHLALASGRSMSMLGLVSPLVLAAPLARQWASRGNMGGAADAQRLDRWFAALAVPARPLGMAVAGLCATVVAAGFLSRPAPSPAPGISPQAALRAAKAAGVGGEVLNDYDFGGFLIFQGVKVFIDGRSDMYGDAFMRRYMEVLFQRRGTSLAGFLDEHRIGWTLLSAGSTARSALDRLPGWREVYADDVAVVHMRVATGGASAR